jgi:uncharacterized protein (TIRG00374 family)
VIETSHRPAQALLLVVGLTAFVVLCDRLGLGVLVRALEQASLARFAVFLSLSVAVFLTYAVRWRIVLRATDEGRDSPPLLALLSFRAAGHSVSALLPSAQLGGDPVRALLLRRRGREWTPAVSSVALDRLLETSAAAVAGPIYVAVFLLTHGSARAAAPWVLALMVASIAALGVLYATLYRGSGALSRLVRRAAGTSVEESLSAWVRRFSQFLHTPSFPAGIAVSLLAEVLVFAEFWALSRAFALPISLPMLAGVMVGLGVAQLAPVPGALGTLEAAQVGVLTLAGAAAPLGLAVGLIVRLRESLWILIGLAVLYGEGLSWRGVESFAPATTAGNTSAIDPNA